jgi:hypothetical protein
MLQDSTINAYRPGHIILIAMSQPANFCVCHRDLVLIFIVSHKYVILNVLFI